LARDVAQTRDPKAREPEQAADVPKAKVSPIVAPAGTEGGEVSKADPSHGKVTDLTRAFELVAAMQRPVLNGPATSSKAPPPQPGGSEIKLRKKPTPPSPGPAKTLKADEHSTPASSVRPPRPVIAKQPPSHSPGQPLHYDISGTDKASGPKESRNELWWRLAEQDHQQKAALIQAKERELIDRAREVAAREAAVEALKGSVIQEGSGIVDELANNQRRQ